MSRAGALALVESPAQLLNVIELGFHDAELGDMPIAVLAPTAGPTRTQLRATMALARQAGHEVTWYEPRIGGASVARTIRALAGELGGVERLVVGDPFSGVMQVIISISRSVEVTIVDDGTATLEFARQWTSGEHLSRWHQVATPHQRRHIATLARDQIAGSARRRLSPTVGCRLRVFTCMPIDLPKVEVLRNDYAWVRDRYGHPRSGRRRPRRYLVGRVRGAAGRGLSHRRRIPRSKPSGQPLLRPPQGSRLEARSGGPDGRRGRSARPAAGTRGQKGPDRPEHPELRLHGRAHPSGRPGRHRHRGVRLRHRVRLVLAAGQPARRPVPGQRQRHRRGGATAWPRWPV